MRAEQHQVVEAGDSTCVPLDEVVSLGPGGWDVATREQTAAITSDQGAAQRRSNQTMGTAQIEDPIVGAEHDRDEIRVAGKMSNASSGYRTGMRELRAPHQLRTAPRTVHDFRPA